MCITIFILTFIKEEFQMKNLRNQRILAAALALAMMLSMMLVFTVSGSAADNVYTLDVADLSPFAAASKYDGEYAVAGDHNYFTVIYSAKAKVEVNEKTFSDGASGKQRIAWGDKTTVNADKILNAVKIKTEGSATVKIWWVGGDANRNIAIFTPDGEILVQDNTTTVKNELYVTELEIPAQGIYYIGNVGGSNYFYKLQVTDNKDGTPAGDRADFASVAAPVITNAADDGSGNIVVKVNAEIGHNGADELLVHMYNDKGEKLATRGSVTEKSSHTLAFTPADSGTYSFVAELYRGEDKKDSAALDAGFSYILGTPSIASATSKGGGSIEIKWNSIHEAESYNIYQDGIKIDSVSADKTSYIASGLTVGSEYSFVVSAVRKNEENKSDAATAIASKDAQVEWGFTVYGPSTNAENNGFVGSVNDEGWVTVYSEGGKGKIQPKSVDGLAFYYTAIPTEYNFTLRAKVSIDSWKLSNGQEGFGLIVTDRLGENGNKTDIWNNSYLAGSTKIEYKYNSETEEIVDIKVVNDSYLKFSMKLGIGSVERIGVTKDNLALFEAMDTETINNYYITNNHTLETTAANITSIKGSYNVIGKFTETPAGTFEERFLITEYIMEIQKNNSGYYISYYDAKSGELIACNKYYTPDALNQLDEDYVYAGFFASRNCRATFSDIEFSTILASEDAPREYPETKYVTPSISVSSGSVTTKDDYELIVDPKDAAGWLTVRYEDTVLADRVYLDADERFRLDVELLHYELNTLKIEFAPDPDQYLGDYVELANTRTIYTSHDIMYNRGNYHVKTIYVSPDVKPYTTYADGTKEHPYDLFTALENACPGQTIILMEGTYRPKTSLTIQRGMDGTADAPIRLIADPEAKTRPVIDFEGMYSGFTHAGDYWYFYGFDVTGSMDMQKGFQVSGSYNVLDQINAYRNGNTGIQICRLSGGDLIEDWPAHNLILNCTAYENFDAGFEDADGFAAKLTVGEGNVFDGCVAYHNADDGWDLYAKVETGSIGAVTLRNCIAYENGFIPGMDKTGNGNGFKLGGSSLSGKHVIENSIAFNNLAKGIDCNSCPDIIVKNCVSFNNGSKNYAFYTNNVSNTAFKATNVISFRTEGFDVPDELKGKGTQLDGDYKNTSTYYYFEGSEFSANTAGVKITADMFVSLEFNGWTRNADGTINLGGFLQVNANAPENVQSAKLGGTPSYTITLDENEECSFSKAWYKLDKTGHWHSCSCGNKSHLEEHDFMWITDKPVEGDTPGQKHQECTVCGYKKAAITVYPESEVKPEPKPEQPDNDDNNNDGDTTEPEQLNFFEMIWQWILDLLRSIFPGLFPAEGEQAAVHKSFIS